MSIRGDWLSKLGDIRAAEIMQLSERRRTVCMCVDVEGCQILPSLRYYLNVCRMLGASC